MAQLKLHPSNWVYIGICIVSIAAFSLVGIYPNAQSLKQMDKNIAELQHDLKEQELLNPVYRQLVKEVQQQIPPNLPLPKEEKAARETLGNLNAVFQTIADRNGVVLESAVPDARSYLGDSGYVILDARFRGDFFRFRDLLASILTIPYLEHVDQMLIETKGREKVMALKLRLAQV